MRRRRSSFDRKDHALAAQQFRQAIALLDDPDMGGKLTDLRTLSAGFLDLAVAAMAPPPAPAEARGRRGAASRRRRRSPDPNRVYTMGDTDVTAPVTLRQEMPRLTPAMKTQAKDRGVIEIVIDELGRVSFAAIRASVHLMFDAELLSAAREWKYQPATLAGRPVKYRKMIQINVNREQ